MMRYSVDHKSTMCQKMGWRGQHFRLIAILALSSEFTLCSSRYTGHLRHNTTTTVCVRVRERREERVTREEEMTTM